MPTITETPTVSTPPPTSTTAPPIVVTIPAPGAGEATGALQPTPTPTTPTPTTANHRATTTRPMAASPPGPGIAPPVPPPAPAPTTAPLSFVPGETDLRAALLTPAELPAGFADAPGAIGFGSLADCPILADDPPGATASVTAAFVDEAAGLTMTETLLQFNEHTAGAMATFATLPTACARFDGSLLGIDLVFTTAALSAATVGDRSVAVRMTIATPDGTVLFWQDVLVAAHGGTVIMVSMVNLTGDPATIEAVARRAVDKVSARW
ncbi:hypothetical protein [Actinokineospora enzanensis]|uniref:hypothetical protein n=1 Tax=Actinokineospora enzanensis TaxID=155975 RepID=UPI000366215E|nr:hypothetical protein [Actinokineospora enzanensis]